MSNESTNKVALRKQIYTLPVNAFRVTPSFSVHESGGQCGWRSAAGDFADCVVRLFGGHRQTSSFHGERENRSLDQENRQHEVPRQSRLSRW